MKKQKKDNSAKTKLKNTIAVKRNVYAVVLSVIFIVAVIGLIALSTVLAQKYPLELDLTTNKQHSISGDNFDYISSVEQKINIYVTSTEDAYNCNTGTTSDIGYIAASSSFVDYSSANVAYYRQTVELLKKYQNYNDNITVTFVDVYDAKAREITDRFEDYNWSNGDILVESTFMLDGKEVTRRTVVSFSQMYTLEDTSGMAEQIMSNTYYQMMYGQYALYGHGYGYSITENNVETMISSAIYKVTSPNTPVFLVPTAVSDNESVAAALENMLEINNFEIEYNDQLLSALLTAENYDKYDGIILSNCKADITVAERELIENFLDNNGKKGKALYYFAGTNTYNLTNLCGLLGDWGIGFESGILYETDSSYHNSGNPTQLILESSKSEYTETADALGKYYAGNNLVYMKQLWPTSNTATYTRETTVLLQTASFGQTTVMPLDADYAEWTPASDAQKDKFAAAIFSRDDAASDNNFRSSYVVAFAAAEIIDTAYTSGSFANLNLVLDTFNSVTGNSDAAFSFVPKKIETETFSVTEGKVNVIRIIFMAVVPAIVIVLGVVVWIRRKRK